MNTQDALSGIWFGAPGGMDSVVLRLGRDGGGSIETLGPSWSMADNFRWCADQKNSQIVFTRLNEDQEVSESFLFGRSFRFDLTERSENGYRDLLVLSAWNDEPPEIIEWGESKIELVGGHVAIHFWRDRKTKP